MKRAFLLIFLLNRVLNFKFLKTINLYPLYIC
jgi:hypothetical protein